MRLSDLSVKENEDVPGQIKDVLQERLHLDQHKTRYVSAPREPHSKRGGIRQ